MKEKIHIHELTNEFYDVHRFWEGQMPMMAAEEAGEFIQAISKLERFHRAYAILGDEEAFDNEKDQELTENLIKEAADLIISIGALGNHYGYTMDHVEEAIVEKLKKTY